ncbi:MAG: carbohydrate kinase [Saprospiraceae bacterium]|nr:carbohydrate kinase [Saprospiraceae bacterium]
MGMYLLGLDIGSSSIKAALVGSEDGKCYAMCKFPESEMHISSPMPLWAEQDAEHWWQNTIEAIRAVLLKASVSPSDIIAIGIAYQMHGLVAVDNAGKPVRPAIIWCDSRAIPEGHYLTSRLTSTYIENNLYNRPGNFTASKLYWMKVHEQSLYDKVNKIMLPGDYIAYRLSGKITTTITGLSEAVLWDFPQHQPAHTVFEAGQMDANLIPVHGSSFDTQCTTNESTAALLGIAVGTPISYRAGDQPNNAFALGVLQEGQAAATAGTSGVVYAVSNTLRFDEAGRVNTFAHVNHSRLHPKLGTLLCINGTGILYRWIKQNLFFDKTYDELEQLAATVKAGSDGLILHPFGNGAERMLNNENTGASLLHLDFNRHNKNHVLRAALEGIAFSFVYGIEILKKLGIQIDHLRVGDDNLFQSRIFAETIASLARVEIVICKTSGAEGAARGAGIGLKGGLLHINESHLVSPAVVIKPEEPSPALITAYEKWKVSLPAGGA